jgi:filamentous hemagglutinin
MYGDTEHLLAGAGGSWPVIGETPDPDVVRQQDSLSCGVACGEMVLRDRGVRVDQSTVAVEAGGVPVFDKALARALQNLDTTGVRVWQGGPLAIPGASRQALISALNQTGTWIAFMKERTNRIGHTVVVDGLDAVGHIRIRDPWEGTRYTMTIRDFLHYWTDVAVFGR